MQSRRSSRVVFDVRFAIGLLGIGSAPNFDG